MRLFARQKHCFVRTRPSAARCMRLLLVRRCEAWERRPLSYRTNKRLFVTWKYGIFTGSPWGASRGIVRRGDVTGGSRRMAAVPATEGGAAGITSNGLWRHAVHGSDAHSTDGSSPFVLPVNRIGVIRAFVSSVRYLILSRESFSRCVVLPRFLRYNVRHDAPPHDRRRDLRSYAPHAHGNFLSKCPIRIRRHSLLQEGSFVPSHLGSLRVRLVVRLLSLPPVARDPSRGAGS